MNAEFNALRNTILEDDRTKKDYTDIQLSDLVMRPDGRIVRKGSQQKTGLHLNDFAMAQAFNRVGIPVRYGKKMFEEQPSLIADHFNHWASQDGNGVLLRTRGDVIRGFLSEKYTTLDNKDVIESLDEVLNGFDNTELVHSYIDDKRTNIRMTFPALTADFGKASNGASDILKVGIDIDNSEVGASSLRVVPMVLRLVCTNGMRSWQRDGEAFSQRHIHLTSDELFGRMSDAISHAVQAGDGVIKSLNESRRMKVRSPFDAIKKLAEEATYSGDFMDKVQQSYSIEPDPSLYGVVNAFTRASQSLNNERRVEVEQFAGGLLDELKVVNRLKNFL